MDDLSQSLADLIHTLNQISHKHPHVLNQADQDRLQHAKRLLAQYTDQSTAKGVPSGGGWQNWPQPPSGWKLVRYKSIYSREESTGYLRPNGDIMRWWNRMIHPGWFVLSHNHEVKEIVQYL